MADPWHPTALSSRNVLLVPLTSAHYDGLCEAVRDGELWKLWYTSVPAPEEMHREIERRLALAAAGSMIPFTLLDGAGRIAGMTTFMNIDRSVPRVEIGSTWIAWSAQRSSLNTEAKLLLLRHAFTILDCAVVEFRTHALNFQSRRAIERLGAKLDGILRHHTRVPNGTLRDTAVYSIVAGEWPTIQAHLQSRLKERANTP